MGALKLTLLFLNFLAVTNGVNGQPWLGTEVMQLPTLAHNVSGVLFIEDDTTFNITNFYYDGLGPDTFLYFYYPGDPISNTGGGTYTSVSDMRVTFEVGRPYLGETLRFSVPEGHRSCDYGGFSIWCRRFSVLFTWTYLNSTLFSDDGVGDTVTCAASPGRAYVGSLPTMSNGAVSGDLFVKDNKTLAIRDFNYDGSGQGTFVYTYPVGMSSDPSGNGNIIRVSDMSEGQFEAGTSYTDQLFEISIPADTEMYLCDIGTFTIWSRETSEFYTELPFNLGSLFTNNPLVAAYNPSLILCDRPNTRPGVLVGELTKEEHDLEGTFYVQDDKTFYIQLFSYDGRAPATFLYYYRRGQTVMDTGGGYKINLTSSMEKFPVGTEFAYKKQTFVVDLNLAVGGDVVACDIEWFTLWCEEADLHFTRIQIPRSIFTTDENDPGIAMKTKVLCTETSSPGSAPLSAQVLSIFSLTLVAMVALLSSAL